MKRLAANNDSLRRFYNNSFLLIDEDEESLEETNTSNLVGSKGNKRRHYQSLEHIRFGVQSPHTVLLPSTVMPFRSDAILSNIRRHWPIHKLNQGKCSNPCMQNARDLNNDRQFDDAIKKSVSGSQLLDSDSVTGSGESKSSQQLESGDAVKVDDEEYIVGFSVDSLSGRKWHSRFEDLKEFKKKFGHCNVPRLYDENKPLGKWVANQRAYCKVNKAKRQSRASRMRIKALEEIGFEWSAKSKDDRAWDHRFAELEEFKNFYGHCNVPQGFKQNPALADWVSNQRYQYKMVSYGQSSYLSDDRIAKLVGLGFEWNPSSKQWQRKFEALKEYKKVYGDCDVPANYDKNIELGRWVSNVRLQYKKKTEGNITFLSTERIEALNELGFNWDIANKFRQLWDRRYEELVEFKRIHGHCNVSRDRHDKVLGRWVLNQRFEYKRLKDGKMAHMNQERINKLEDLDFKWEVKCGRPRTKNKEQRNQR